MNKAQALFLVLLAEHALKNGQIWDEYEALYGTYGRELAEEAVGHLRASFQLPGEL